MNEETKLLPCPFCGHVPWVQTAKWGEAFSVVCRNAKCFGPATPLFGNEPDAIEAWNRRAPVASDTEAAFQAGVAKGMFRGLSKPSSDLGISAIEAERAMK